MKKEWDPQFLCSCFKGQMCFVSGLYLWSAALLYLKSFGLCKI